MRTKSPQELEFARVRDMLLVKACGDPCPSHQPKADDSCECRQHYQIASEVARWLGKDPRNVRRLAAIFKIAEEAKAAKVVYLGQDWSIRSDAPTYQYYDEGQLAKAIKHLADLDHDLGAAYQSILDGRM